MGGLFYTLLCTFLLIVILLKTCLKNVGKFFCTFVLTKNDDQTRSTLNLPPSPPKLPIIGNLHQVGKMPHLSLTKLAHELEQPLIFLQLGEVPTVVISSAKMAEEVTRVHDRALTRRPQLYAAKWLFYNYTDIIFSPFGDYWKHVRSICMKHVLNPKRVQSYGFVREDEVSHLVQRITDSCSKPFSLTRLLGLYANDVLCRVALGRSFSEGGEYDMFGFKSMLDEYQELLGGFSLGDFFPSLEILHSVTGHKSRVQRLFERFDEFFDEVVREHLDCKRENEEEKDLVDVLLDVQKKDGVDMPRTIDNVKAVLLDMFAAGTDTTFITLDWAMTELIMNPEVMNKAQTEVRSIVGERTSVLESVIPQLQYLEAIIKETFRLHPPSPVLIPRESSKEVTIASYNIPAKTRIYINAWAIGRDSKSWEDPETFKPQRFVGSKIDFKGGNFELLPFGSGTRICPGISFGTATVKLALAQLLHSFDWELPPGVEAKDLDLTECFGISMHKISDLIVVAKPHFA